MDRLLVSIRIFIWMSVYFVASEKINRFTFKVTEAGKEGLIQGLKQYNFTTLYQITPSTFVFEYTGEREASAVFNEVKEVFRDLIEASEPVKVYNGTLKPGDGENFAPEDVTSTSKDVFKTNLVCTNYYGCNVSEVWEMNITGKGVNVGVNDVGINTNLKDLQENIKKELSVNLLTNSRNVAPEEFMRYKEKSLQVTDHGNRVASVVAAIKGNNICSAGIAYNASIVPIKIFNVTLVEKYGLFELQPSHWTTSDTIARAFSYRLDEIDIFVNAWTATRIFDTLDLSTKEALRNGANNGRFGRGTIYLVPAGPAGNGLTNNINTITVGSTGRFGTIPDKEILIDASVITVGLHVGNNLTAEHMVTVSYNNKCVTSFKGVSAATAQVAGIIALCLEVNPNLSKRDVEHLLVHASGHSELEEKHSFTRNGAGLYYHKSFGFGLLNAWKLVTLAKQHNGKASQLSKKLLSTNFSTKRHDIQMFEFCFYCDMSSDLNCLSKVEHAEVAIDFKTETEFLHMELISPSHTRSILMHHNLSSEKLSVLSSLQGIKFVSVHFWEETPFGKWTLELRNHRYTSETRVSNISLILFGTKDSSQSFEQNTDCARGYTTRELAVDEFSKFPEIKTTPKDIEKMSNSHVTYTSIYVLVPLALCFIIVFLLLILLKGGVQPIIRVSITQNLLINSNQPDNVRPKVDELELSSLESNARVETARLFIGDEIQNSV